MIPAALKNRELSKLLAAQLPADFSDWLDIVAIGALLTFVWDSPDYVFALLAASMGAPYLVVGLAAGALVDRWQIRSVLVLSNLARAGATAGLFFAADWWTLLILVALRSSVDTFFTPAKQAAIQALTNPEERSSANGLSHAINQASKIVAPGAGGAFLIWYSPEAIFLINASVSVLAALLALRLHRLPRTAPDFAGDTQGLWVEIIEGIREVRSQRIVSAAILLMAGSYFAMFVYDMFIYPLTRELGFSPAHLGVALAAVGTGGVLGALVFGFLPDLRRPNLWIAAGLCVSGILAVSLGYLEWAGVMPSLALFVAIFAGLGVSAAMTMVPFRTVLQNNVREDRMGRVTALGEAFSTLALLSAPFVGAAFASAFSVGAPFLFGGLVMFAMAICAIVLRLE